MLHVLERGQIGAVYNVAGGTPHTNLELTAMLLERCGRARQTHVRHVEDRLGHDRRYAIDAAKLHALGWQPKVEFDDGISRTVEWYRDNEPWWRPLKTPGATA